MSKSRPRRPASLGDRVALEIQELHRQGKVRDSQPLLRIDQRKEAAAAPFQFDAVRGILHRNGCRAIPASSKSALYGVWEFRASEPHVACPRCKPLPSRKKKAARALDVPASDLVYGVLSILDQFGGVLRERGREYRRSQNSDQLRSGVRDIYELIGSGERDVLNVIAAALDGLSSVVNDLQRGLAGTNGHGANGRPATNGTRPRHQEVKRSTNGTDEP
jgi:hypothetical protein